MEDSLNTTLNLRRQECSFILNIAEQCAVNSDSKISKGAILRTLIRLLQHLEVDVSGVKTEDQLFQRIQNAIWGSHSK